MSPGETLRGIRERLGLTVRDVEGASGKLAQKYKNSDFSISISRLSDIETKGVVPSIFKIYSLASIYRRDPGELVKLYGVDFSNAVTDSESVSIERTHLITSPYAFDSSEIPTRLDSGFDTRTTFNVGRMIRSWGVVPMSYLKRFADGNFSYGFIGSADLTMYPLLLPGTFVQIDEKKNKVTMNRWRSEYERPIYFIETRDEFLCSWCEESSSILTVRPHPLSPSQTRVFKLGSEAEVLGQVVGIAMRLQLNDEEVD